MFIIRTGDDESHTVWP